MRYKGDCPWVENNEWWYGRDQVSVPNRSLVYSPKEWHSW